MPKVSVILTSYNHEKYLAEAVQSVLAQTFEDYELLIFDDGSTDSSQDILRSFTDPRIRLFLHEKNRGPNVCLQEVLAEAKGKYVAIHHSDDAWMPEKLARQTAFLDSHADYAACFTQVCFMDEESHDYELPENHLYCGRFKTKNRTREEWLHEFFFDGNCLCHPSLLIRREMYEECGLISPDGIAQLPDFLMWVRLCRKADLYVYPEELVRFRLHTGAAQNTSADSSAMRIREAFEQGFVADEFQKLQEPLELLRVFPELQEYVSDGRLEPGFAMAQLCLRTGRPQYMLKALQRLFELLQDEAAAVRLQELYGYTWKSFVRDTGRYDVFAYRSQLYYLSALLYYDDGTGFSDEKRRQGDFYVAASGDFTGSFVLEQTGTVRDLILNLNQGHLLKAALKRVTVNGEDISWEPVNASGKADGMDLFFCPHPQYRLHYEGAAPVRIVLQGCMDTQADMNEQFFAQYIELGQHFQRVCKEKDGIADELNRKQAELQEEKIRLQQTQGRLQQTEELLAFKENELQLILNTRGERFLRKLRHIRDYFKRS